MIAMQVDLDFACCKCGVNVGVKLKCEGKGLAGGGHCVAAVEGALSDVRNCQSAVI